MAEIVLDNRLAAIASMVEGASNVADIGADHGRLGAYLLQNEIAEHVQFLDVSADSLGKARRLIDKLGLIGRASFAVGDGTAAMDEGADAVIVAGMGGQLIADIVEAGIERLRGVKLVLQPNVAGPELRLRLSRCGFKIVEEQIVCAAKRLYVVMAAIYEYEQLDKKQMIIGPRILDRGDPLLKTYAEKRLSICRKALRGAVQGDAPWCSELEYECRIWEEIANGSKH